MDSKQEIIGLLKSYKTLAYFEYADFETADRISAAIHSLQSHTATTSPPYNNIGTDYPPDALNPDWEHREKVHNWRNYISDPLRDIWGSFTDGQKAVIAASADDVAGREEWD